MCVLIAEPLENVDCNEQLLCQKCGLCCNGALFGFIRLGDEDVMHIETHITDIVIQDRNRSFKQPCRYLKNNSCSIYRSWRPLACATFECKLLIRYRQNRISFLEAVDVIEQAVAQAKHVRNMLSVDDGDNETSLQKLFDEYVAFYPNPDQSLILEYGVLQFRLKHDFRRNSSAREGDDEMAD